MGISALAVTPWKNEFRVLFAPPGATAPQLGILIYFVLDASHLDSAAAGRISGRNWSFDP